MSSLYTTHADWFHLLTAPADYLTEAEWLRRAYAARQIEDGARLLELGSGGGNMASHLRPHYHLTLTDLSPAMLAVSETINPGVSHIAGDMRSLRLDEPRFDAVLIHDAIDYMVSEADLRAAFDTAFAHLRPGGVAIIQPDDLAENFEPGTGSGGHDGADGRGLRYLEWTHPPDADGRVRIDFAVVLRHADGSVELVHDVHTVGLFARAVWRDALAAAGFADIEVVVDDWEREVFIARRPDTPA